MSISHPLEGFHSERAIFKVLLKWARAIAVWHFAVLALLEAVTVLDVFPADLAWNVTIVILGAELIAHARVRIAVAAASIVGFGLLDTARARGVWAAAA